MIGIVIVANGNLARELLANLEHILGGQDGIVAISIDDTCDRKHRLEEIAVAVDKADIGQGVAIVTDIYGSSPSNLCLSACKSGSRTILSGANLPMLIKLAKSRKMGLSEASDRALSAGKNYMRRHDCGGLDHDDCPPD